MITTQTRKSPNMFIRIKVTKNPSTNNTMMKIKSKKKGSSKELSLKRISLSLKRSTYREFPKPIKSRSLLYRRKPVLSWLIPIKSTAGGFAPMHNSDPMSCPTSTKTTSSDFYPQKTKTSTSRTSTSTPSATTASLSPKAATTSTLGLKSPK